MPKRKSLYGPTGTLWAIDYRPGFVTQQQLLAENTWRDLAYGRDPGEGYGGAGIQLAVINLHNGYLQTNAKRNLELASSTNTRMSIGGYIMLWSRQSANDTFAGQTFPQRDPGAQVDAVYNELTNNGGNTSLWRRLRFIALGLFKNVHPLNRQAHGGKQAAPGDVRKAIAAIEAKPGTMPIWIYTDEHYYRSIFTQLAEAAPNNAFQYTIQQDQYANTGSLTITQALDHNDTLSPDDEFRTYKFWERDISGISEVGDTLEDV